MSKSAYRSDFVQRLNTDAEPEHVDVQLTERRLGIYGLCLSLSVICAKIMYANRDGLHGILFEDKLLSYETIETNGQLMLHYVRSTVLRSSKLFVAFVCGAVMSAFTWIMIYLDSSVPGVQPPTPFSPSRYKERSGHSFHLGYIIAIVNGLLVFMLMLVDGFSIY